jgi:hypothetical protein
MQKKGTFSFQKVKAFILREQLVHGACSLFLICALMTEVQNSEIYITHVLSSPSRSFRKAVCFCHSVLFSHGREYVIYTLCSTGSFLNTDKIKGGKHSLIVLL